MSGDWEIERDVSKPFRSRPYTGRGQVFWTDGTCGVWPEVLAGDWVIALQVFQKFNLFIFGILLAMFDMFVTFV